MLPLEYIAALSCALAYAFGAFFSKGALERGSGIARTQVGFNWILFLLFVPIALFYRETPDWTHWHWPLLCGMLFFVGQLTTFAAIRVGDVSVQSPMMGTKMVFVAGFASLLSDEGIPGSWWWGAFLSMVGIILLSAGKVESRRSTWLAIVLSLVSAASFGLCDVLVAEHARAFSAKVFPIFMMGVTALLSLSLVPFFRAGFSAMNRDAWRWYLLGGFTLGGQGVLLYLTLSHFGKATAINILYSSRGIWSVVLVWLVGVWFAGRESRAAGTVVMMRRLIGAALMLVAIFLVLEA